MSVPCQALGYCVFSLTDKEQSEQLSQTVYLENESLMCILFRNRLILLDKYSSQRKFLFLSGAGLVSQVLMIVSKVPLVFSPNRVTKSILPRSTILLKAARR